tara:strand:- start:1219 stop:2682 length:1464 start_codon:yes stop_codon:yes gene_type:complete
MTNLSDLLPAGASGKKVEVTASGAISNGDTVILNTNGTVSVVAAISESKGSAATFESAHVRYFDSVHEPVADKIVISYADAGNGYYLTVVVGDVSGSSITFGTPVVCYSYSTSHTSIAFNSNNSTIGVAFQANTWGRHAIGSVSGTAFTLGGTGDFYGATAGECSLAYNAAANRWLVMLEAVSNSNYPYYYSGTGSATGISWNGANLIKSAVGYWPNVVYDSNAERMVFIWRDYGNSNYGTAVVGEINSSKTGYDLGTAVVFESGITDYPDACFDSDNNLIVIGYRDTSDSNAGKVIAGEVSGSGTDSTIEFGDAVAIGVQSGQYSLTYDEVNKKVVIGVRHGTNGRPYVYNATVSSDKSISLDSGFEISTNSTNSGNYSSTLATYDPDQAKVAVLHTNSSTSGQGTVYQPPSSNALPAPKFVGVAEAAISDTATGEVTLVGGISEKFSGLTIGSTYYLQSDGSASTTTSPIVLGVAISATSILLNG